MKKLLIVSVYILLMTGNLFTQNKTENFLYKNGDFTVYLVSDSQGSGNESILIDATPEMLRKYTDDGKFPNAMNAFLLRTPTDNILFDSGMGMQLFSKLAELGISPENIDKVFITHMHGDHIGGMLKDGKVSFPNAQIYLSQPEYNYWTSDEEMIKLPENSRRGFEGARKFVEAYKDRLSLYEPGTLNNGLILIPGITAIAAYGHTPGHTMYEVESSGQKLLIWGDLTHALSVQLPYPQISVTYDVDPVMASESRREVLRYVSENKIPIAGMHVPYPSVGNIKSNNAGGYIFNPALVE